MLKTQMPLPEPATLALIMGGKISVASERGRGSTFSILFEKVSIAATPAYEARPSIVPEPLKFKRATVLIADNAVDSRRIIIDFLKDYDFEFVEARDGREAVKFARRFLPDVIFMDIKMPAMNGLEATRIIRTEHASKNIAIIATTASLLDEGLKTATAIFDGCLRKPIGRIDLVNELKRFIPHTIPEVVLKNEDLPHEPKNADESISHSTDLPKLVKILEDDYIPELKKIRETLFYNDLEIFLEKIESLGIENDCKPLLNWVKKISRLMNNFDLKNLPEALEKFIPIIEKLKYSYRF